MYLSLLPVCGAICFLGSIWLFFFKQKQQQAIWALCLAAFALRLYMALVDPFLHDWDERFHALVAKHMIAEPFKPMLRLEPILPYDYTAWCCNHIWVHKQPLFMWQMALFMKIFGINEWALRLPTALLSAAMTYWVYRIVLIWTLESRVAFTAAVLSAFSYYQMELTAGYLSLDHNDLVFTAYLTAGIWAFCEYTLKPGFRWALLAGLFTGLAILVKWLTALLVFGGAGLYLLSEQKSWTNWTFYKHWLAAFGLSMGIMAPWQWHITRAFPKESAWEYEYNFKHITDKLGAFTSEHPWYYLERLDEHYGVYFIPFLVLGVFAVLFTKNYSRRYTLPLLGMTGVVYVFFSLIVQTKMAAFTYIVCAAVFGLIAIGLERAIQAAIDNSKVSFQLAARTILFLLIAVVALKPWQIRPHHSSRNPERQAKINNTRIFKNLNKTVPPDYVVFNCKSFEDTELMFYQNYNAYHWFPPEKQLDSLLANGHKIAAFQSHTNQGLPEYMSNNPRVLVIKEEMK